MEYGMEFDTESERVSLRMVMDFEHARSIYGSTVSRATFISKHSKPHQSLQAFQLKEQRLLHRWLQKKLK